MIEPTLEFIGAQLERVQTEQRAQRTILTDLENGLLVIGNHLLRIERDMEQVKRTLAAIDSKLQNSGEGPT